ncbi:MAG: hypothetical protein AAFX99_25970, partial [Myxococcota bacterium]
GLTDNKEYVLVVYLYSGTSATFDVSIGYDWNIDQLSIFHVPGSTYAVVYYRSSLPAYTRCGVPWSREVRANDPTRLYTTCHPAFSSYSEDTTQLRTNHSCIIEVQPSSTGPDLMEYYIDAIHPTGISINGSADCSDLFPPCFNISDDYWYLTF